MPDSVIEALREQVLKHGERCKTITAALAQAVAHDDEAGATDAEALRGDLESEKRVLKALQQRHAELTGSAVPSNAWGSATVASGLGMAFSGLKWLVAQGAEVVSAVVGDSDSEDGWESDGNGAAAAEGTAALSLPPPPPARKAAKVVAFDV